MNRKNIGKIIAAILAIIAIVGYLQIKGYIHLGKSEKTHYPTSHSTTKTKQSKTSGGTNTVPDGLDKSIVVADKNITQDEYGADMKLAPNSCQYNIVNAETGEVVPDRKCSPGAIDTHITQSNIATTICKSGYTATIRPDGATMKRAKMASMAAYGITEDKDKGIVKYTAGGKEYTISNPVTSNTKRNGVVEYDHIISLQLGGANLESNLYPEPPKQNAKGTTNPKDAVENKLNDAVCSGKIQLVQAQNAIATDWTTAEQKLGLK